MENQTLQCTNCGDPNPSGKNFCGNCGQSLHEPEPSLTSEQIASHISPAEVDAHMRIMGRFLYDIIRDYMKCHPEVYPKGERDVTADKSKSRSQISRE